MGCCGDESVEVSKMALELKSGQMLYYKHRMFGKNWKDVYVSLYNDSTFAWYHDKGQTSQEGGLIIKNSPDLMAYGQFTRMVPGRPQLPECYSDGQLLAFGTRQKGYGGKPTVYWFLCPTDQETESWVTAIISTLPPPPKPIQPQSPPPAYTDSATSGDQKQYANYATQPANNPSAPQSTMQPYLPLPPDAMRIPGQYPTPTGMRPQYTSSPLQPAYPYGTQMPMAQPAGGNTTVVVQDRRYDTGGDFAMGMLLGTTVGYGWGHGWGWSGHCGGWGGGGGGWHSSNIHDTDVTINNYYDVDNTVINNDVDIDASQDIMAADFGGGDFGGGDFGGGDFGGCDF